MRIIPLLALFSLANGFVSAETPAPRISEIRTTMVAALTGPQALTDQKVVDVCGTDIGTMTELNGRIFFAFGDTFGYDGDICRGIGGPNWRSNVFAATTDRTPADGIELQRWLRGADGRAIAVIEGAHQPPFTGTDGEQTKIPTAMIAVGDQIYLHYMSVHGFAPQRGVWECNFSKWVYSTYLNEHTASLELREAEHLWGPWSVPNVLTTAAEFPQLYGAFMTPSFLRDGGHT
jgi:Domain of unknown function (DUF4185)